MTGRRLRSRIAAAGFGALVTVSDRLPPHIRYGYVHRITARLLRRRLPHLPAVAVAGPAPTAADLDDVPAELTAALVADHLDVGGIGSVIEMLARHLPAERIRPVIVCPGGGARADRLRTLGIEVRVAATTDAALEALRDVDVVALHSAPVGLERAAVGSGRPLVTVMHNTEIHFTPQRWASFRALMERSDVGVAVSETVRAFHARHVPESSAGRMRVVPNGASEAIPASPEDRAAARNMLATALRAPLGDDVVFSCLARYDSQKNVAGTVASFLRAMDAGLLGARFVYAGEPSDWAEFRRADAIRRSSAHGDRVHLLGNSDARTLLLASDAFLLNSFFEGWAMAATEAAASGLPLLLSEVGGAAELVAFDTPRSVLIPNAVGASSAVTDARVVAARRHPWRQSNRSAVAEGLALVAARVRADPERRVPPAIRVGTAHMVRGHADALRGACDGRRVSGVA